MAMKTFGFLFVLVLVVADAAASKNKPAAETASKNKPAAETERKPLKYFDIIHGAGEVFYDIYSGIYEVAADAASKHGIDTKVQEHLKPILSADHIGLACSKLGCNKKDVTDKLSQAQATLQQVKAQVYEHAAKANDALNGFADVVATKLEKDLSPSYEPKFAYPKDWINLSILGFTVVFVVYKCLRWLWFMISTALSIYCYVCCCGCARKKRSASAASSGKKKKGDGSADAKAAPKQAASAKSKGKK
jgi:hypothetical protein